MSLGACKESADVLVIKATLSLSLITPFIIKGIGVHWLSANVLKKVGSKSSAHPTP
jgi:hypothetical protein